MKRITPLNVVAALAVAGLIATTVIFSMGAEAKPQRAATHTATFRQALAAKLAAQLHKPADQVLAALKSARQGAAAKPGRAKRLTRRADRLARRAQRIKARAAALQAGPRAQGRTTRRSHHLARQRAARDAWAAAAAKPLGVDAADVTAALRTLVAERLDSLVSQGWVTADRRTALLACFDDSSRCGRGTRPPGLAFLRRGL